MTWHTDYSGEHPVSRREEQTTPIRMIIPGEPHVIEAKEISRAQILRLALWSIAAWIVTGLVAAAIYLWGLYAIGLFVFAGMIIVAGIGFIDLFYDVMRRRQRRDQ